MNNTVIFQHKYLKYKNKYQILKNKIIQKGSGQPPFECLFFSTAPLPENLFGFYEVGIYDAANYKKSEIKSKSDDDHDDIFLQPLEFWHNLENELEHINRFKAAMFDDNFPIFLQFMDISIIRKICDILVTYILPTGIVCIESIVEIMDKQNYSQLFAFHIMLENRGFNRIGTIGIKKNTPNDEDTFYTLYCINTAIILDKTDINDKSRMPYLFMDKTIANPKFKYIKEPDQLIFIMKIILSADAQCKNTELIEEKSVNSPDQLLQKARDVVDEWTDMCIPNPKGQYSTLIDCKMGACNFTKID